MARASAPVRNRPARAAGPERKRSWTGPLAIILIFLGIFSTGAGLGRSADWSFGFGGDDASAGARSASEPVRVSIARIGVDAPVIPVGLAADDSIAVPPLERHEETGWYDRGPAPGQDGPAIIVGHADTRTGPSVFHDVPQLRRGDRIEVVRGDRSVVVFQVETVEHFPKDGLPAERVYGDFSRPGLRLITCGGRWVGGETGYADNVVVFATLVRST